MATNGEPDSTQIEIPDGWRYVCVMWDPDTNRVPFPVSNSPTRIEQYGLLGIAREMIQTRASERAKGGGKIAVPNLDLGKLDLGDI